MNFETKENITYYHKRGKKKPYKSISTSKTIFDNGNSFTSINIKEPRSSLLKPLLILSVSLFLGSFFFNGYITADQFGLTDTYTFNDDDLITSNYSYVSYDDSGKPIIVTRDINYNLKYSNIDYINKFETLGALRNIFDLSSFDNINYEVNSDYPYVLNLSDLDSRIYHYPYGQYYNDYVVYYEQNNNPQLCSIQWLDKNVDGIGNFRLQYLQPTEYFVLNMFSDSECKDFYYNFYVHFVNATNNLTVIDREIEKYKIENGLNTENWYDNVEYAFKILVAPVFWVSNLIYDLGVITKFVFTW